MLQNLAREMDADTGVRFAEPDRQDVAELLRWLADGHFVLLGSQLCAVKDGTATVDETSRLGVARLRTEVLPELTEPGDLLVLAQATMPSFLRYGAYPYIVVIRETRPAGDVEHRFVGLFTVAATSANVLDIPLISRRAREVLTMSQDDPSHPGQLMLDILQTIPRSELFSLTAEQMLAMATAVVELGSRRRALLFLRADQLGHFVSCLVYLPRDRYTTVVRLRHAGHPGSRVRRSEHRLHRSGQRIPLGSSAFHSSAARLVHPAVDRHQRGQPRPRAGTAHRGAAHLG